MFTVKTRERLMGACVALILVAGSLVLMSSVARSSYNSTVHGAPLVSTYKVPAWQKQALTAEPVYGKPGQYVVTADLYADGHLETIALRPGAAAEGKSLKAYMPLTGMRRAYTYPAGMVLAHVEQYEGRGLVLTFVRARLHTAGPMAFAVTRQQVQLILVPYGANA